MIQVSQQIVDRVLSIYKPEQRILKATSLDYPIVRGKFLIGRTYYTINTFKHATDIEIQLCLNQLAYVGVAEAIKQEMIPELKGLNFSELQGENMLIIESRKRFRRAILTDREIQGELCFRDMKERSNLLFCWLDFQFENKSCIGSLEVVLTKPNNS